MRLVLDSNVVVAGLLWNGPPRHLLDLAINGDVALFSSPALIDELAHALNYPKFAQRIAAHCATTPSALTVRFSALAANADLIVSGDKHLHSLGGAYQRIRIVTPAEAIHSVGAK